MRALVTEPHARTSLPSMSDGAVSQPAMRERPSIVVGYSGTPVAATKLGIESTKSLVLRNAPDTLELLLPDRVTVSQDLDRRADVVLAFFTRLAELEQAIDALASMIFPAGCLWVAWPKKASRVGNRPLRQPHTRLRAPTRAR